MTKRLVKAAAKLGGAKGVKVKGHDTDEFYCEYITIDFGGDVVFTVLGNQVENAALIEFLRAAKAATKAS